MLLALAYPTSSQILQLSSLSHVVFLLYPTVPQSVTDARARPSLTLRIQTWSDITTFSFHPRCVSPDRLDHMRCSSSRPRRTSPRSASCCQRKKTAAAPTVTQRALSRLQGKPVIYSLLYIHSSRGNTRGYSWDGVLPCWRSMPLSPSHILGLGIT